LIDLSVSTAKGKHNKKDDLKSDKSMLSRSISLSRPISAIFTMTLSGPIPKALSRPISTTLYRSINRDR
jgi:hypothetical protein